MQNVSNYCAEQKLDYSLGFCGVRNSTKEKFAETLVQSKV